MSTHLQQIRELLTARFNSIELRNLYFDLGIDSEDAPSESKSELVRYLIEYCQRHDRLTDLLSRCKESRPTLDWPDSIETWPDLAETILPPCPYRGLSAFREVDTANFFGRDVYTTKLIQEVNKNSLLAVVGPSGSGKSSVVFAGLVPALCQKNSWLIIDFRPGRDPFRSLAIAILAYLEPGISEVDRLMETGKLASALEVGKLELAGILERLLELNGPAERVLLIADQFEEIYTLCDDLERRRRFLDVLLALPTKGPSIGSATLCLTLRADFMGQALSYRPFADRLQDHDVKLGPMNREELRAAIVEPAKALNVDLEPGLANRILGDVGQEPGNLPLLEFALTLLWEEQQLGRLTHEAYDAIGQVQGALARHAEVVFARLSAGEQATARSVFIQLIQPGAGTADTRRLATREEVGEDNWMLVQQLAGERLLTTGGEEQGPETVEVAHEALMQHWRRLEMWMAEDRAFREWQQRLRSFLAIWQSSGHDDGALLRGAPLAEAEAWLIECGDRLPDSERAYINVGISAREAQARTEEARLQKELALAQAVAEAERRRAREQEHASRGLRWRSTLALVVAIMALLAAAGAFYFWTQAERGRRLAEARELAARSLEIIERNPDQALYLAYQAAQGTLAQGDLLTGETYRALYTALTLPGQTLAVLKDHSGSVWSAAFSLDGRHILTASGDGTARLWRNDGQPLTVLKGHFGSVQSVALSPDGQRILTAGNDGTARLWDIGGQPLTVLEGHFGPVWSAVFSPDGQRILTAGNNGTARLWDDSGQPLTILEGHSGSVSSLVFSPDGQRIVTGGDDGTARLWDGDGQPLAILEGHLGAVSSVAISPDGQRVLTADNNGTVWLWDGRGQLLYTLKGHSASVSSLAFSPDGQRILTASIDGTVRLLDGYSRPMLILAESTSSVPPVAFSADGQRILAVIDNGTLWLWDGDGRLVTILDAQSDEVWSPAISPSGKRILTSGNAGSVRLWDVDGQPVSVLEGHLGPVSSVAFSSDSQRILTASDDGTARLWDGDGRLLAVLEGHTGSISSLAFSPDGNRIVTAGIDETVRLWDGAGQLLKVLEWNTPMWSAAFSPNGQRILTIANSGNALLLSNDGRFLASMDFSSVWPATFSPNGQRILAIDDGGTAQLLDSDGQQVSILGRRSDEDWRPPLGESDRRIVRAKPRSLAIFNPNGQHILTASDDGTARLWDSDGQLLAVLEGHTDSVLYAAFSSDGKHIVTASNDSTARLWDGNGQSLLVLEGHSGPVRTAIFSPDGQRILTAGADNTVRLWKNYPTIESMLSDTEQALSRILPYEECVAGLEEALCQASVSVVSP